MALAHPAAVPQVLSSPVSLASSRNRGRLHVRAARVAGVEIPNQKRLETALTCVPCIQACLRPLADRLSCQQVHLWHWAHHGEGHPVGDGAQQAGPG